MLCSLAFHWKFSISPLPSSLNFPFVSWLPLSGYLLHSMKSYISAKSGTHIWFLFRFVFLASTLADTLYCVSDFFKNSFTNTLILLLTVALCMLLTSTIVSVSQRKIMSTSSNPGLQPALHYLDCNEFGKLNPKWVMGTQTNANSKIISC